MRNFRGQLTRSGEIDFWTEIERCHLLISRLNDEDMRNGLCATYLRFCLSQANVKGRKAELVSMQSLFAAWSTLNVQGERLESVGFEFDEHWRERMNSANDHIFSRLAQYLHTDDGYAFDNSLAKIYTGVLRDEEFGFGLNIV